MPGSLLSFEVDRWEGRGQDPVSATLADLRITLTTPSGEPIVLTEVHDDLVRSVRPFIVVSLYPLARWFILNWWRLRWEPFRPTLDWRMTHSMAAVGEGTAWPPVEFASDGEFVQVTSMGELSPDVAAIRYLRDVTLEIPGSDFERAIDDLIALLRGRLASCRIADRDLDELWEELQQERADPRVARACRLQAEAGINPGEAPDDWLAGAARLEATTGSEGVAEVMAVLPGLGGITAAEERVAEIRRSPTSVDLSWAKPLPASQRPELPWQRGARLAQHVRDGLGLKKSQVLSRAEFADAFGVSLPLASTSASPLNGAYRNGTGSGRVPARVAARGVRGQRFALARLAGCAVASSASEHLLPVTNAQTALQKMERAFAQELLCPWEALNGFTDAHGVDDEGVWEAAEHFDVSEMVILTTLVNKKKISRDRLPSY